MKEEEAEGGVCTGRHEGVWRMKEPREKLMNGGIETVKFLTSRVFGSGSDTDRSHQSMPALGPMQFRCFRENATGKVRRMMYSISRKEVLATHNTPCLNTRKMSQGSCNPPPRIPTRKGKKLNQSVQTKAPQPNVTGIPAPEAQQ